MKDQRAWNMFDNISPESAFSELIGTEECKVLKVSDDTGEGIMTVYEVFDGVYLMFSDFHMQSCHSELQNADSMLCIEHCREGRIEHTAVNKMLYYMEQGDLRVDSRVHHEGQTVFPLNHYHGITIGFQSGIAERSLREAMPSVRIDIAQLAKKFCGSGKPFVIRADAAADSIFRQLYQIPARMRTDYYKVKVMELLIYLNALEISERHESKPYFYASQVEKVKAIHKLMTEELDVHYTTEQLSKLFDIAPTPLKSCFKGVYGAPIYTYMKKYRMNKAASLLKCKRELKIADIALMVGYDSPSKFSAAFRDVIGAAPAEYRSSHEYLHIK